MSSRKRIVKPRGRFSAAEGAAIVHSSKRKLAGNGLRAVQTVRAVTPHPFADLTVPKRMDPDSVFDLVKTHLNPIDPVDAVYFQGAVLDPIKALENIETELSTTAIASNPAMLWYVLSQLNLSYPMAGYGRLIREWPALPA
jgi:hypothetical protein